MSFSEVLNCATFLSIDYLDLNMLSLEHIAKYIFFLFYIGDLYIQTNTRQGKPTGNQDTLSTFGTHKRHDDDKKSKTTTTTTTYTTQSSKENKQHEFQYANQELKHILQKSKQFPPLASKEGH